MFPEYHVISKMKRRFEGKFNLEDYYIISVQHILETTGSLFEALISIGFKANKIYLTGKIYSTHEETKHKLVSLGINITDSDNHFKLGSYSHSLEGDINKMWDKLSQKLNPKSKIIILDDGGYTLKNIPDSILRKYPVFGIEQTTSGIRMQNTFGKFPVIHLAASAAKIFIEPTLISKALKIHLGGMIEEFNVDVIGVIGYGHIGKAIVNDFRDKYDILVFDLKDSLTGELPKGVKYCRSVKELYDNSPVIIGATGQDVSDLEWIYKSTDDKILLSLSSGDIEFNSLLKACDEFLINKSKSPLNDLLIRTPNHHLMTILRGGMVANFTGESESGLPENIQITRGLIFSAIIQILQNEDLLKNNHGAIMLDPRLQSDIVQYWFEDVPIKKDLYNNTVLKGFQDLAWIIDNSNGDLIYQKVKTNEVNSLEYPNVKKTFLDN